MEIISVCPECNNPGIEVKTNTLKNVIMENKKKLISNKLKYYICTSPKCIISYYSNENNFSISDIKTKIWYKNTESDVPICYCSNLTRGEIIDAVKNGCKTIDDIQKYANKNKTGKCEIMNPLGKCCRDVFLYTMKDASK